MQLNAGAAMSRQNASSSGISHRSIDPEQLRIYRNQLTGFFCVMPALLDGGQVRYGVPFDMARKMADDVINEKKTRIESNPPDRRQEEFQKEIDKLRQAALKVRLAAAPSCLESGIA